MNDLTVVGLMAFALGLSIGALGIYYVAERRHWALVGAMTLAVCFGGVMVGSLPGCFWPERSREGDETPRAECKFLAEIDAQLLEMRVQLDDIQTSLTQCLPPVVRPTVLWKDLETGDAVNVPRSHRSEAASQVDPQNGAVSVAPPAR